MPCFRGSGWCLVPITQRFSVTPRQPPAEAGTRKRPSSLTLGLELRSLRELG